MTDEQEDAREVAADQAAKADLMRKVEFGLEVEQAVGKRIVNYLIDAAIADRNTALLKLAGLDPYTQQHEIIEAQTIIKAVWMWQDWLGAAVQAGRAAEQQLIEREGS